MGAELLRGHLLSPNSVPTTSRGRTATSRVVSVMWARQVWPDASALEEEGDAPLSQQCSLPPGLAGLLVLSRAPGSPQRCCLLLPFQMARERGGAQALGSTLVAQQAQLQPSQQPRKSQRDFF